jgi:hypothetical protein
MVGPRSSTTDARLRRHDLPRPGRGSVPCRWCGRSFACCDHPAQNFVTSGFCRNDEEDIVEMDQGAGSEIQGILLATRLWRVLSEPESVGCRSQIRGEPGRAPSKPQFSGGVPRFFVQIRHRIRRAPCVGLKPRLIRAFSARVWKDECLPGALPQALDERAPLALKGRG